MSTPWNDSDEPTVTSRWRCPITGKDFLFSDQDRTLHVRTTDGSPPIELNFDVPTKPVAFTHTKTALQTFGIVCYQIRQTESGPAVSLLFIKGNSDMPPEVTTIELFTLADVKGCIHNDHQYATNFFDGIQNIIALSGASSATEDTYLVVCKNRYIVVLPGQERRLSVMATDVIASVFGTTEYPNPRLVTVKPPTPFEPGPTHLAVMYAKHATDRSKCCFVVAQVKFAMDDHAQCIMVPDQRSFIVERSDLPSEAEVGVAYARGTIAFAVATKKILNIYTLLQTTRLPDTVIESTKSASFETHSLSLETVTTLPHMRSVNIGDISVCLSNDKNQDITAYFKDNTWFLV